MRDAGDPVEQAALYDAAGADELCFLDITASHENRDTILDVVSRTAARVFLPLTVGGGIRSTEDMRRLLLAGTDKCSINSAAVARPELVREAAQKFGSQCVVVAVDAKQSGPGRWEVFTHGGRRPTGIDAVDWCRQVAALGAGEILLTSMDRDGTGLGFDLDLLRAVCGAVRAAGDRVGRRGDAAALRRGRADRRHRPAGGQRVPFRHLHHCSGEGGAACGRPAGAPAAPGRLRRGRRGQVNRRRSRQAKPKPNKRRKPGKRVAAAPEAEVPRPPPPLAIGQPASVLDRLWSVVMSRRTANPAASHSARLLSRGTAKVAQKFGEESVECLIEAVAGNKDAVVAESADVLYHLIVLWVACGIRPVEVWDELKRREGISGIAEKAARARKLPVALGLETTKIP